MKKINFKRFNIKTFYRLPPHEKKITLSTFITLVRIILIPFVITSMIKNRWGTAFILFIVAVISDVIDGWVARLRKETTFLGATLDALADKALILSCFFTLAFVHTPLVMLPLKFVFFVLIKELIQIIGAFLLYMKNGYLDVRPTFSGKCTMFVESLFIIYLFACYFFKCVPGKIYYLIMGFIVLLVTISLIQYTLIGYKTILQNNEKNKT